jgi:hypothetical protein
MLYQLEFYLTDSPDDPFYYTVAPCYPKIGEHVQILTKGEGYTEYLVKKVEYWFNEKSIQSEAIQMVIWVEKCQILSR